MADKAISELIEATDILGTDSFVLEQNGAAKRLTGQTLLNWLLKLADGHGGIQNIQKTGSNGFVDTYTITYADSEFTTTFTVTNGRGVKSFAKTKTQGLTDTYTITYDDNTTSTMVVSNGRGVVSVELTSTNLLEDTYTITYNDDTTQTYTVKNGRGIKSFTGPVKDGLKDTYTITYDDNTTTVLSIFNGEKGDKGDNAYLHIKYAFQKPTPENPAMSDIADNWIGLYTDNKPEASTDYEDYEWFKMKGEKGDTGDPATLLISVTEYQVSTSGSIIPSGSWSTTIPANVPQGQFLWTRVTQRFNTGSPVISYSIARWGIDGTGSVSSVAGVAPDSNGNVQLTAEDVDALPANGGAMYGAINMQGQPITGLNDPENETDAARKSYVDGMHRTIENITVAANLFTAFTDSEINAAGYGYRAVLPLEGALESMVPSISYSPKDSTSRIFAPFADSYDGGIYLYAARVPDTTVTLSTIILFKEVA